MAKLPETTQPTVHPIVNAQGRILNPSTGRWDVMKQPVTSVDLDTDHRTAVLLRGLYTEMRLMNYLLAVGLNINEDLDQLRAEYDFTADVLT